jgi:thymidylate kinase
MSKLIVIRGNSGSGKSTLASSLHAAADNAVIIAQDYYIKYTPATKTPAQEAARKTRIFNDVKAALSRHDTVILEGVFDSRRYTENFTDLISVHPTENYFYYLDISFEETLRRHTTRDKRHEFGEQEMSGWYRPHDQFGYNFETVFNEQQTIDAMLEKISASGKLKKKEQLQS